jgi:2-dehydro-3-deoxyglucarate aldolase/4-hydroxy-2-oxoheptanedioate aldolase
MTDPLENRFKTWLQSRRSPPPLGTWLMAAAPATAEALGWGGFDFLVVDLEHVPLETADMIAVLRAMAPTPAEAVVRLAWNDTVMVKRAMDGGARTLLFPFVQNEAEAVRAVAATRYPPEGVRGVAAVHRGSRYGAIGDYLARANAAACVMVQLETPSALERLEAIAAVPGVDALFVGPADLAAGMGHLGNIDHPDVQAAIAGAAGRAARLGMPIGIVGGNPGLVRRYIEAGFSYVAIGSDLSMMTGRAAEWLGQLRGTAPAPAAAGGSAY